MGYVGESAEADELLIYLDNERDLYERKKIAAAKLAKWLLQGKYDHARAPALFMPIVETAARRYAKEFGTEREWNKYFPAKARQQVAKDLADRWIANAKAGRPEEI